MESASIRYEKDTGRGLSTGFVAAMVIVLIIVLV